MLANSRERELKPAVTAAKQPTSSKVRKALSVLQLVAGIATGLFLAGVVAPTVLREGAVNSHKWSADSTHMLVLAGITFTYTLENLGFAILGALFGAVVAWAIECPTVIGKTRLVRFLRQGSGLAPSREKMQSEGRQDVRKWLRSAAQQ